MTTAQQGGSSWDRLQDVLVATKPGHVLSVDKVARETGLASDTARLVLDALTRAELFIRTERGMFRRRSLSGDRGR